MGIPAAHTSGVSGLDSWGILLTLPHLGERFLQWNNELCTSGTQLLLSMRCVCQPNSADYEVRQGIPRCLSAGTTRGTSTHIRPPSNTGTCYRPHPEQENRWGAPHHQRGLSRHTRQRRNYANSTSLLTQHLCQCRSPPLLFIGSRLSQSLLLSSPKYFGGTNTSTIWTLALLPVGEIEHSPHAEDRLLICRAIGVWRMPGGDDADEWHGEETTWKLLGYVERNKTDAVPQAGESLQIRWPQLINTEHARDWNLPYIFKALSGEEKQLLVGLWAFRSFSRRPACRPPSQTSFSWSCY